VVVKADLARCITIARVRVPVAEAVELRIASVRELLPPGHESHSWLPGLICIAVSRRRVVDAIHA